MMPLADVLRRPLVTERTTQLREQNKYVFEVDPGATKGQIREAVQSAFKVDVLDVNTMNVPGKLRRRGAHAGYRIYACKDGRVALAALEPHFARSLCQAAGITEVDHRTMMQPQTQQTIAAFLARQTRQGLDALALAQDIPLFTLAP